MRLIIAPSLLSADFGRMAEEVRDIERAGADWHHVDVMDGHFVPNFTFGPDMVAAIKRAATKPLDVHLMFDEPERYAETFRAAGADIITFHPEVVRDPAAFCARIRGLGARAGVSLRPHIPLAIIEPYLAAVDLVMVMTVHPGFGGQTLIPECLAKAAALRRRAPALDIEVDGGVNAATIGAVAAAGVNVIVAGAGVFRAADRAAAIAELRAACEGVGQPQP